MSIMSIERGITGHEQKHKPLKDVWQAMCINLNVNLWWGTHHISFMHSLLSSTSISLLRDWTSLQFNYQKNMHILSSILYKEKNQWGKYKKPKKQEHYRIHITLVIAHDSQIPRYTSYCFIGNFTIIFIPSVLTLVRMGKE